MMSLLSLAWAGSFEPVLTDLGGGAKVDWTALELRVEAGRARSGSEGTKAVEELARRDVDQRLPIAADAIRTEPGRTLADLRDSPELWPAVRPRLGRWVEVENRYHSSGRVAVIGALSLVDLLKPVSMATATARTGPPAAASGAVLDARGLEVEPCFAPVVRSPDGERLYEGRMWLEAAVDRAPVVWISDAAHPVADRAGSRPIVARVEAAEGCVLTLPARQVDAFRALTESRVAGDGAIVVVVDP